MLYTHIYTHHAVLSAVQNKAGRGGFKEKTRRRSEGNVQARGLGGYSHPSLGEKGGRQDVGGGSSVGAHGEVERNVRRREGGLLLLQQGGLGRNATWSFRDIFLGRVIALGKHIHGEHLSDDNRTEKTVITTVRT